MKIKKAIFLAVSIVFLVVVGNYLINNLYLIYSTVDSWYSVNAETVATQAVGRNGVVVSTQKEASSVGLEILKDGGNAIDAAVAVGYALAVSDPCCGNLGGGGFMLIHLANGTETFIDFRETAPGKATADMYLDETGDLIKDLSTDGYLAVGVPGTVKGLNYALDKYGTMQRKQVINPAVALAANGFKLQPGDIDIFQAGKKRLLQPNVASIFLQDNKTYQAGDTLIQPELANTLSLIAEDENAFYQGEIAKKIVAASEDNHGILSLEDFANYQVTEYEPVSCDYRGYQVISAPPPGGGTTVCQMLNILSGYNLTELGWKTPQSLHPIFSSMLFAFGDRNRYLGDPHFVDNPVDKLLSPEYAATLRDKIAFAAIPPESVYSTDVQAEGTNTTHYSVVDKEGNAVAVTYTINSYFGAGVIAPETGFLLNNEMDDFTTKLGEVNQFGLRQGEANLIEPGKRPLSSMSPTIVTHDGQVYLVTGSPGGSTIPTTVLQIIINAIDYGMNLSDAVNTPRLHYQGIPNRVVSEPEAINAETFRGLKLRGYEIVPFMQWGAAESILVNPDGTIVGVNDIRKPAGKAIAY
ncbi:MAG TPA: gamma-glutamyltransferase [Coleofasciculaceae cyanobacterium]|jgi:gamma-glutamyltranspeptidase/glutathione hydrolase